MSIPSFVVVGYLHFGVYDESTIPVIAIASFAKIIATVIEACLCQSEDMPSFSLGRALDALLSPTERKHPYHIFTIPGLLAVCSSWVLYIVGTIVAARHLLFVEPFPVAFRDWEHMRPSISLFVGAIIFSLALNALVLTPLEVIMVRLSIQAKATRVTLLLDTPPDEDEQDHAVGPVRLRTDENQYAGLISCARLIIQEEGWGALYRGWWWTAFRGILFI
ncbi:hypothetical protein EDB19DRAFT_1902511 [Suillus lakei]|nr:hypothetical protein EDB19DRAFT_1902511 [Suillus lakei]